MPIYIGDSVRITMNVGTNIDGVTVLIKFRSPKGKTGIWRPEKLTSTSVFFVAGKKELNEDGSWSLQAFVPEWPAHGKVAKLFVNAPLF